MNNKRLLLFLLFLGLILIFLSIAGIRISQSDKVSFINYTSNCYDAYKHKIIGINCESRTYVKSEFEILSISPVILVTGILVSSISIIYLIYGEKI